VSTPPVENPNEVFVGNLSFFCDEHHLLDLFEPYSTVTHCRVMRNEEKTRSLLFGFVAFSSRYEMLEMCKLFNGHFFFGRRIR
jgi:RNA recognition motif-containing protein